MKKDRLPEIATSDPHINGIQNIPYENRELHESLELWRQPEWNSPYLDASWDSTEDSFFGDQ